MDMEKFAEELKRKSGADGGKAWEIVESWYTRDGKARRLSLHDLHELSQAIAKELARIRAEARAEAYEEYGDLIRAARATIKATDRVAFAWKVGKCGPLSPKSCYIPDIARALEQLRAAILADEPKDLECSTCGRKESAPYDEGDSCYCGGKFLADEPKEDRERMSEEGRGE